MGIPNSAFLSRDYLCVRGFVLDKRYFMIIFLIFAERNDEDNSADPEDSDDVSDDSEDSDEEGYYFSAEWMRLNYN